MTQAAVIAPIDTASKGGRDIGFAAGIIGILCVFFLPIPAFMIDMGLAFSIALSVLILMVSLWIEKPLEFSAFPTILLVATMLRLSLNIATTRLILTDGAHGVTAAGYIIGGFARMVMGGDFVIGLVVFAILITVNFLVITKGATRIAEVGARFTLDAIPGKQMAIDADLSAGLINEKEAQQRRRELEEESSFFGSMDGASKFVRGDAIAGLIILAVNVFGGIVIGVTRHDLDRRRRRRRLHQTVGRRRSGVANSGADRLARRRACWCPRAARAARRKRPCSVSSAIIRARCSSPAGCCSCSACTPMLPFFPFAILSGALAFLGRAIPQKLARDRQAQEAADASARRGGQVGSQELGQGIAAHARDRTGARQAAFRAADAVAKRAFHPRGAHAAQIRRAVWIRRPGDQGLRQPHRAAEMLPDQDSRRRSSPRRTCASANIWSSAATASAPTRPARKCANPPSA